MTRPRDTGELLRAARDGDRAALARLLSIVERGDRGEPAVPACDAAYAVGVTGAPGSGKSTLVGALLGEVRAATRSPVAVLAVDPSSPVTGGAILGDRVRMQNHALDEDVFIRSMATRGHLGGLSAAVPEALRLLSAAGWPLAIVETVGVGQVEIEVAAACDTVVVVVTPGWGDSVQANKAGLLEVADVLVVNKADRPGVPGTVRDLRLMIELSGALEWTPPIVETVATTGKGVGELWAAVTAHRSFLEANAGGARRAERAFHAAQLSARARLERALQAETAGEAGQETRAGLRDGALEIEEAAAALVRAVAGRLSSP